MGSAPCRGGRSRRRRRRGCRSAPGPPAGSPRPECSGDGRWQIVPRGKQSHTRTWTTSRTHSLTHSRTDDGNSHPQSRAHTRPCPPPPKLTPDPPPGMNTPTNPNTDQPNHPQPASSPSTDPAVSHPQTHRLDRGGEVWTHRHRPSSSRDHPTTRRAKSRVPDT